MKKTAAKNLLIMLLFLAGAYFVIHNFAEKKASLPLAPSVSLSDIPLTSAQGKNFSLADFRGQWVLVFFGYMTCPDVCPTTLAYLKNEYKKAAGLTLPQLLFISVDPKRDDPDKLDQYVKYFRPEFRAATGSEENLQLFAKKLGAFFSYEPVAGSPNDYLVQHSSSLFLIDRHGKLYKAFTSPHANGMIAAAIANLTH